MDHVIVEVFVIVGIAVIFKQTQVRKQHLIAMVVKVICDAVENIRHRENGHILNYGTDAHAPLRLQVPRHGVRHIVHLLDDLADLRLRLFTGFSAIIYDV